MKPILGLLKRVLLGRDDGVRARVRRAASEVVAGNCVCRVFRTRAEAPAAAAGAAGRGGLGPAPEGYVAVARIEDVPPGRIVEVIADGRPLALCNVDGEIHAVASGCPHAGGPLGDGHLEGHSIVCPYHGWAYDVRDGTCVVDGNIRVGTSEVRVIDGLICVR